MITGIYEVAKTMAATQDGVGMRTKDEMIAYLNGQKARGEVDDEEIADSLQVFDARFEITPDGQIITLMKMPEGASEQDIEDAITEGEILGVKDGYIIAEKRHWELDGDKYVYAGKGDDDDDGVSGTELKFDDDGLLDFAGGIMKLKKIK